MRGAMNAEKSWESGLGFWSLMLLVLGIVFSLIALLIAILRPDVERDFTAQAEGVVSMVEVRHSGRNRSRTSYVTYVEFEDSDHRSFEAQSVVNGDWYRHREGDHVTVRYNPRSPEEGVLIVGDEDKLGNFNVFGSLMLYGGIASLVIGVACLVIFKVRSRQAASA